MKNNTLLMRWVLFALLIGGCYANLFAQTGSATDSALLDRVSALEQQANYHKTGEDHFMVVGLTTFGFVSSKTTNTVDGISTKSKFNNFPDANHFEFSPMFLWRHGTKFLMEFEPSFSNNGLGVNWADISYFVAPNVILRAGYLVLPFGTYSKRLAAGWINKFATDPIGISRMTPADYGIEVEGGLPLGNMKMSYDFSLTTSNQLMADGTLSSGGLGENNNHKTITGRLSLLPLSNSSLEMGISGMYGKIGSPETAFQNATGKSYAFDLNYVKTFAPILLNFKAQYNIQNISNENYVSPLDSTQTYSFNNHTTSLFTQCSIRPTGANNFLRDCELAGRYSMYNTPANSTSGSNQHSFAIGLNYWLSWRSVFKLTYDIYTGNSTASKALNAYTGTTKTNALYLQFSIQL